MRSEKQKVTSPQASGTRFTQETVYTKTSTPIRPQQLRRDTNKQQAAKASSAPAAEWHVAAYVRHSAQHYAHHTPFNLTAAHARAGATGWSLDNSTKSHSAQNTTSSVCARQVPGYKLPNILSWCNPSTLQTYPSCHHARGCNACPSSCHHACVLPCCHPSFPLCGHASCSSSYRSSSYP
jgi:hypothetical protein